MIQISKETKKLKALLQEYNVCQAFDSDGFHGNLTIADVLDLQTLSEILHPKIGLYTQEKQELIDAYTLLQRSVEEIKMLESEMKNVICYYEHRKEALADTIHNFSEGNIALHRGACALLLNILESIKEQLDRFKQQFSLCSNTKNKMQSMYTPSCYDDSSDSSVDSDSDIDSDDDDV